MSATRYVRARSSLAGGAVTLGIVSAALLMVVPQGEAHAAPGSVTTITVGGNPRTPAVSETTVFVPNQADGTLSVIDRASATVTSTVNVGAAPTGALLVGKFVYVPLDQASAIAVVNAAKSTLQGTIPVGSHPGLPVLSPDGRTVLVSNAGDATVSVIDTASRTVTATIPVGGNPKRAAFGTGSQGQPYTSKAFVPNSDDGTVSVIDLTTNSVSMTIKVPGKLSDAVASPVLSSSGYFVFLEAKNLGGVTVVAIDQATGASKLSAALDGDDDVLMAPVVFPDGSGYVAPSSGALDVMQLSKGVLGPISEPQAFTKGAVGAGALSPDGKWALFTSPLNPFDRSAPYVSLLNIATMKLTAMLRVGNRPETLAFGPSGETAYVSNAGDGTVSVVDLSRAYWPSAPRSPKVKQVKQRWGAVNATVSWKPPSFAGPVGITDVYVVVPGPYDTCVSKKSSCTIKGLSSPDYTFAMRARSPLAIGEVALATARSGR